MPPNIWAAFNSGGPDEIMSELDDGIRVQLVTHELYQVLRARVKRMKKRHKSEVLDIIENTKTKILSVEKPDVKNEQHLESFQKQNDYLKEALDSLRKLEKRGQGKSDLDEEVTAMKLDKQIFEKAVENSQDLRKRQMKLIQFIEIHSNVDSPPKKLREINQQYKTYQQLLWYLSGAKLITAPQLWIKCKDMQQITVGGARWEYRWGRQEIESDEIYVISATRDRSDYIITVVLEGSQENPVVLDLPKCGQPEEDSLDLEAYLRRQWPNRFVEHAMRFSEPTDDRVLVTRFDNSTFEHRTNDLYVKCRRIHAP